MKTLALLLVVSSMAMGQYFDPGFYPQTPEPRPDSTWSDSGYVYKLYKSPRLHFKTVIVPFDRIRFDSSLIVKPIDLKSRRIVMESHPEIAFRDSLVAWWGEYRVECWNHGTVIDIPTFPGFMDFLERRRK